MNPNPKQPCGVGALEMRLRLIPPPSRSRRCVVCARLVKLLIEKSLDAEHCAALIEDTVKLDRTDPELAREFREVAFHARPVW